MNFVIISKENKILHIINYGYQASYCLYNYKGSYLTSGSLESYEDLFNVKKLIDEVILIINEDYSFSSPYIFLLNEETRYILKLIAYEQTHHTYRLFSYIKELGCKDNNFFNERRWGLI